ncbi:MAG: 4Fe-4S binding protein [Candidatus Bathyarchaeota archaeon]|nr:4Fe-4S binding protein [Candidatus Bathyarchaeum tardum]
MVNKKRGKSKNFFWIIFIFVAVSITVGALVCQPVSSCYGPHITATISSTEINIYENVTVTGTICLGTDEEEITELDRTVRVTFVRPDYSYIDQIVIADPETGDFAVTQALDMAGYWNVFPILGHINDRLGVTVTDPNADPQNPVPIVGSPFKPNLLLITAAISTVSIGGVFAFVRRKNKSRKISALRLFIQVGLVFLIFFGMFIDHEILPVPASRIPVHEFLVGTNVMGVEMADGFPVPFFGCYYPCGRTVTCALWEIQTYLFPFWEGTHGWGVDYNSSGLVRLAVIFGIIILLSIIFGKAFCGWVCPFGLYMDLLTYLRKNFKIPHKDFSKDFNKKFHQLGYVILALIIVLSFMFGAEAIVGAQLIPGTEKGGFVYQYFSAPFCQVCPMKPFCVLLEASVGLIRFEWIAQVTTGTFFELGYFVTSLNLMVLGVVTVVSFYYRRAWCRLCPLGALIALFHRFPPFKWISVLRLEKLEEKCTKCGICKRVCPTQVTEVYEEKGGDVTTSNCILCLRCLEMCPEKDALKLKAAGKTVVKSRNWLDSEK